MTKQTISIYPTGFLKLTEATAVYGGRSYNYTRKDKPEITEQSLRRSQRQIKDLALSNLSNKVFFLTLTFKENISDFDKCFYEWKKFKQKMERKIKKELKYLLVYEYQKRGALHFHIILFDFPFVPSAEIEKMWGNGFIKINQIRNYKMAMGYLTKYMLKKFSEKNGFIPNRKRYFYSKNLARVVKLSDKDFCAVAIDELYNSKDARLIFSYFKKDKYYQFCELFFSKSLAREFEKNARVLAHAVYEGVRKKFQEKPISDFFLERVCEMFPQTEIIE